MLSLEKIKLLVPASMVFELQGTLERFVINTERRAAHFVSQMQHESANFTKMEENLNYKDPNRLAQIFRTDFDKDKNKTISPEELEIAKGYVGKPEAIANFVYALQNGNGDEKSGDGWKYKGRGPMMTTGRTNYLSFAKSINDLTIMDQPELLATAKYGLLSAGFYWDKHQLNRLADQEDWEKAVKEITKKINGGYIGLEERVKMFQETYNKIA